MNHNKHCNNCSLKRKVNN